MNTELTWPAFQPVSLRPIQHGITSGCTRLAFTYNELACAILLMASGITNAASRLETVETLHHIKESGARQITSGDAYSLYIYCDERDVATPLDAIDKSTNADAISELRLLTGFTWDQIARLFSVSRRSVHLWASGETMSSDNEEHLHRLLGVVKRADRGRAEDNRAALLSSDGPSNLCAFDLLVNGDYEGASVALGIPLGGSYGNAWNFIPSSKALSERAPLAPDVLLSARQDDRPLNPRRARAVNYRKVTRDV